MKTILLIIQLVGIAALFVTIIQMRKYTKVLKEYTENLKKISESITVYPKPNKP